MPAAPFALASRLALIVVAVVAGSNSLARTENLLAAYPAPAVAVAPSSWDYEPY